MGVEKCSRQSLTSYQPRYSCLTTAKGRTIHVGCAGDVLQGFVGNMPVTPLCFTCNFLQHMGLAMMNSMWANLL